MNKKELLKIFDLSSLVSMAIATILVFIFQFTGDSLTVRYALVLYTSAFLLLSVFLALKTIFCFRKIKIEENEAELSKKDKIFLCIKLALAVVLFVFSLVIFILY